VMTVNFVVRGALTLAFLVGLVGATRLARRSVVGAGLLGVRGIGAFLLAAFPTDVGSGPPTVHGQIHVLVAAVAFVGGAVGELLLSRHIAEEPRLRGLGSTAPALAWTSVVFLVITLLGLSLPFVARHAYGLVERVFIGLVLLWMLVVALQLLRAPSSPSRGLAAPA